MTELIRALRRLGGRYVPYLQPFWSDEDYSTVERWLRGDVLQDAAASLRMALHARFPECGEIVLTDTGKTALYVAMRRLGIEGGREVIMPSYCCSSVLASILRAGCVPVLADSDAELNLDYESVLAALSPRTGAIVVAHLFGRKADSIERIVALGRSRGIAVIEDVTQAFGLRLDTGMLAGSAGDAAIFSAGPGKPIMGPGGGWALISRPVGQAVVLSDEPSEQVRDRVRGFLARFTGPRWRRGQAEIGHALRGRLAASRNAAATDPQDWARRECRNHAMSDLEAWLALRQIERIEENLRLRRSNAARWGDCLATARVRCQLPSSSGNTCAILPIVFQEARDAVRARQCLESAGIATEPCYTPLHLREHGRRLRRTEMKVVEALWNRVFAVPVRPNLTERDWRAIARAAGRLPGALRRGAGMQESPR